MINKFKIGDLVRYRWLTEETIGVVVKTVSLKSHPLDLAKLGVLYNVYWLNSGEANSFPNTWTNEDLEHFNLEKLKDYDGAAVKV